MPAEPGAAGCPQGLSWSWQLDFGALMAAVNGTPPPGAAPCGSAPAGSIGHHALRHGPARPTSFWHGPGG